MRLRAHNFNVANWSQIEDPESVSAQPVAAKGGKGSVARNSSGQQFVFHGPYALSFPGLIVDSLWPIRVLYDASATHRTLRRSWY